MKKWMLMAGVLASVVLGVFVFALPALGQTPDITQTADGSQSQEQWQQGCFGNNGFWGTSGMMGGVGMMGLSNQVTLQRVADALGISADQLKTRLQQGETLAQIAAAQNVFQDTVVTSILAPANEMAQVGVKYNYVTAAQAQAMMDQARQYIGQMMTRQFNAPAQSSGTGANGTAYNYGGMMGGSAFGGGSGMMGGSFGGGRGMMGGSFGGGRGMMGF